MRVTMHAHLITPGRFVILVLGLGLLALPGSSRETLAHAADGHPARIHEGTCQALGPVAFRLAGVGASVDLDQQPIATPAVINPQSSYQVMTSETTIPAPLKTVLSGHHALMLYDDDVDMQAVACGNVGGAMLGDTLVVGLAEMGTPGHTGFALFQPDGDQTEVTILIGHAMAPVSVSGNAADPPMSDMGDMSGMGDRAMATPAP
jgi:hypothetical protein